MLNTCRAVQSDRDGMTKDGRGTWALPAAAGPLNVGFFFLFVVTQNTELMVAEVAEESVSDSCTAARVGLDRRLLRQRCINSRTAMQQKQLQN